VSELNRTRDGIEVRPGQIWRDLDKRMDGRHVRIESVSDGKAVVAGVARNAAVNPFANSRISVSRMHKSSTGWELVKDVADEHTA
jgi:hypothetical protein